MFPVNVVTANGPVGTDTIAPDDSNDLPRLYRAIRVNGAGTIKVIVLQSDGSRSSPFTDDVTAGELYYAGPVVRVYNTGTTASGLRGII